MNLEDLKRLHSMVIQAIDLHSALVEMTPDEQDRFRRLYGTYDLVLGGEFAVTHLVHPGGFQTLARLDSGCLSIQIKKQD